MASNLHCVPRLFFSPIATRSTAEVVLHGVDQQHAGVANVDGLSRGDHQFENRAGGAQFPVGRLVLVLQMVCGKQAGHKLECYQQRFGASRGGQEDGGQSIRRCAGRSTATDIAIRLCCNCEICTRFSLHDRAACSPSNSSQ